MPSDPTVRPPAPAAQTRTLQDELDLMRARMQNRPRPSIQKPGENLTSTLSSTSETLLPDRGPEELSNGLRRLLDTEGPRCPTCDNMRVVAYSVPPGHPMFGKTCNCPTCGGPPDLSDRLWRTLTKHFEDYWMHRSPKLQQKSLDDFTFLDSKRRAGKDIMIHAVMDWAASRLLSYADYNLPDPVVEGHTPGDGLVLSGAPGLGKTCAASAAFVARVNGSPGLAIEYNELMEAIQSGYSDNSADEALRAVSQVPVLFLDDMGNIGRSKPETDNKGEILFKIVNHRYNFKLPTIITTNLSFGLLEDQFGYKLARRLKEWAVWIDVQGPPLDIQGARREA